MDQLYGAVLSEPCANYVYTYVIHVAIEPASRHCQYVADVIVSEEKRTTC